MIWKSYAAVPTVSPPPSFPHPKLYRVPPKSGIKPPIYPQTPVLSHISLFLGVYVQNVCLWYHNWVENSKNHDAGAGAHYARAGVHTREEVFGGNLEDMSRYWGYNWLGGV